MANISQITLPSGDSYPLKAPTIPYGTVDSTSTATVYTATVSGITELTDGTVMMLHNGVVTSASGFTINVNDLGAKKVYNNMTNATQDTTIFNVAYTMLFVYSSALDGGNGGWWCYRGYDANTNTIGYQLRVNSSVRNVSDTARYYKIYFTSADNTMWVPASVNSTNNATTARPVNQRPIDPFGPIVYTSANTNYTAGSNLAAATAWQQYNLALGYSFNRTGAALTLTTEAPVYVKCAPQADGSAIMDSTTPYVQALPTTNDGKIYIYLGLATSATNIELVMTHPIYYHDGTGIRLWTGKTIPTKTSELTNDSGYITSSSLPTKTSDLTNDGDGTSVFATMADIGGLGGGTITGVKTTAGAHTTIDVSSGNAEFNVPTKTSHLTNDKFYINKMDLVTSIQTPSSVSLSAGSSYTIEGYDNTSFTRSLLEFTMPSETDPVFVASAAHGISSTDISNWNAKQEVLVSGTNIKTINNESLLGSGNITISGGGGGSGTVTSVGVSNATNGGLSISGSPVTSSGTISIGHSNILTSAQTTQAVYPIKIDKNGHISAYGDAVTIPTKTSDLTNDSGFINSSALSGYLPLSGGTVTGDTTFDGTVTLNSTPTNNTDAATKKYVDDSVKSFGSLSSSISAATLAAGYTPTSDGMLIVTGVAASGKTNYIYIHTNAGTSSNTYYVYGATSGSGGRLGTTIPVHANWTYTMVYTTTSGAWGTAVTGRFVPFN